MASVKRKATWRAISLISFGIMAFLAYLYLFQANVLEIIAIIQSVNLPLYLLAALFVPISVFFYALSWRLLLNFLSMKLSILRSYLYVWYGTFVDIIIPAESVSGEILRMHLIVMEQSGSSGKVAASLVVHRLMGMGISIACLTLGLSTLLIEGRIGSLILNVTLSIIAITALFLALLIMLCVKGGWTFKVIDVAMAIIERLSRGRWKPVELKQEVVKAAKMFHDSIREFGRSPKTIFVSLFFLALSWLLSISITYVAFLALGFPARWSIILITHTVVLAVQSVPLGVPEVGLPEITMTSIFALLGVPLNVSAAVTILNRVLMVWLKFFIGFASQQLLEYIAVTGYGKPKLGLT